MKRQPPSETREGEIEPPQFLIVLLIIEGIQAITEIERHGAGNTVAAHGTEEPAEIRPGAEAPNDTTNRAAVLVSPADALPVRVGVAVVGMVIVFGLIMFARSLNRRPQREF